MSREEVSRLVNGVMSGPGMLARTEMVDVWAMAAKVMAGRAEPMPRRASTPPKALSSQKAEFLQPV